MLEVQLPRQTDLCATREIKRTARRREDTLGPMQRSICICTLFGTKCRTSRHGQSRWLLFVQHQNVSVEDCAESEIRVGWGPAIADRDRADCAVILSYRSASALSPFVSFIIQGAAACVAPALLLLLFSLLLLLLLQIAVADADRLLRMRMLVLRLAQLLLLLLTMSLLQLQLLHLPSPPSTLASRMLLLLLLLLKSDTRF